jgi:hypothetical protein
MVTPETTKYRRRWFQFSLGTLFLLVTVFAVWLGWELHQIRERDRMLRSTTFLRLFENRPRAAVMRQSEIAHLYPRDLPKAHVAAGPPPQTNIPYVWRLLGDKPVNDMDIFLPSDEYTILEARRIQSLFPECAVTIISADPQ